MPSRMLCKGVQQGNVKACPDLASGGFCYAPLHNIWYSTTARSNRVSAWLYWRRCRYIGKVPPISTPTVPGIFRSLSITVFLNRRRWMYLYGDSLAKINGLDKGQCSP